MDFNVADSVRRDIKVLVTKIHYTVCECMNEPKVGIKLYKLAS